MEKVVEGARGGAVGGAGQGGAGEGQEEAHGGGGRRGDRRTRGVIRASGDFSGQPQKRPQGTAAAAAELAPKQKILKPTV
jgi:hypothetical protein